MISKKTRDNLIYLSAGFAAVAYLVVTAIYVPPERRIDIDWMASFGTTLVLFGYPLYWKKKESKNLRFWIPYLCFLAVHVAFWVYILVTTERVALIVFAISVFVEEPFLLGALEAAKRKR